VLKRSPLRRSSRKAAKRARARKAFLLKLTGGQPVPCQAQVSGVCAGVAVDGHEILPRGRGGSIIDASNVLMVCRPCHDFIGNNRTAAYELGLLVRGYGEGGKSCA
jgi:hypothetical protein